LPRAGVDERGDGGIEGEAGGDPGYKEREAGEEGVRGVIGVAASVNLLAYLLKKKIAYNHSADEGDDEIKFTERGSKSEKKIDEEESEKAYKEIIFRAGVKKDKTIEDKESKDTGEIGRGFRDREYKEKEEETCFKEEEGIEGGVFFLGGMEGIRGVGGDKGLIKVSDVIREEASEVREYNEKESQSGATIKNSTNKNSYTARYKRSN